MPAPLDVGAEVELVEVRVGLQRHLVACLGAVVGVEGGVGLGRVQQELLASSISPASMARP